MFKICHPDAITWRYGMNMNVTETTCLLLMTTEQLHQSSWRWHVLLKGNLEREVNASLKGEDNSQ